MSELIFTMFGEPPTTTHHAKKITRVGGFSRLADKPELKNAIAVWESRLLAHRPAQPMKGPVRLTIHAVFTPPKCERSTKAKAARFDKMGLVPKVSKPDCSNFAKTLEDRLVALGFIEQGTEHDHKPTCASLHPPYGISRIARLGFDSRYFLHTTLGTQSMILSFAVAEREVNVDPGDRFR